MLEERATHERPTCKLIHVGETYEGKQGLSYFAGISKESAGATGICMHMLKMPPGARAKAHLHANHETAIYVLDGISDMMYGENLDQHMSIRAGEFLYIPAGMPHQPYNPYDKPCTAILARTDPNEQESVVLTPDLEK